MQQVAYTHEPQTVRGKTRRDLIIAAATELFHERGFHATGIDDIGSAAGITGPGIYRHFASKDEILIAVFDRIWMMLKEAIDASGLLDPKDALDYLTSRHVWLSVEHRAEFALLAHDLRFLPANYQALARMNRATYRDTWANLIVAIFPAVTVEQARLASSSSWRLSSGIGNTIDELGLDAESAESLLVRMTRSAISGATKSDD
jgi:AcrR family transcriptional regulator